MFKNKRFNIQEYFSKKENPLEVDASFYDEIKYKKEEQPKSEPSSSDNIDFSIGMTIQVEQILLIFKDRYDMLKAKTSYKKSKGYRIIQKRLIFAPNMLASFKEKYPNYPYNENIVDGELDSFEPIGFFIETINDNEIRNVHF